MLQPQTLGDLNKAFERSPGGFLVVDSGRPRFAVLDYQTYQSLSKKTVSPRRPKKILVTGGAGYIGAVTVRVLTDLGYDVVVYDNLSTGNAESVQGARLVVGDLLDRAALEKVFTEEKIDAVLHFAACLEVEESVSNPAKYYQNNIIGGLQLLDTMVDFGVGQIVFSSSATVYDDRNPMPLSESAFCAPKNPYGETKLMFERILSSYGEAYGIQAITLRYFNAAGAWPETGLGYRANDNSLLIPRIMNVAAGKVSEITVNGQDYSTQDGSCIRDYIHVLDLADAHVAALERQVTTPGHLIYNVGTGHGCSVLEVIEEAVEITGRMIPMRVGPRRAGDLSESVADSRKFKTDFGWQPRFDLKAILQSSWDWHKMQIGEDV